MTIAKTFLLFALIFILSACSVGVGNNADGAKWFFASVLERTADEERVVDSDGFAERKIGKDQIEGGKVVSRGIVSRAITKEVGSLTRGIADGRQARQLNESASAGNLSILKETNSTAIDQAKINATILNP